MFNDKIKYDVIALGEILIDFTPTDSINNIPCFLQNPGGAPLNVLAQNSKLGGKTAFISKVGDDAFGLYLRKTMEKVGVDTKYLLVDKNVNTTLAFVNLDENGDRSFSFYRKPGADIMINENEIDEDLIKKTHIFHCGSLSLTDEPARSATLKSIKIAKENNVIVSYDPNYRKPLWDSEDQAVEQMKSLLKYVDLLKVSDEEMTLLTGEKDIERGSKILSDYGIGLIFVTLGKDGAFYRLNEKKGLVKSFNIKAIDTTGAGDSFFGAIHNLLRDKSINDIKNLDEKEIKKMIIYGNACGAIVSTGKGAITPMADKKILEDFLKGNEYVY